ncbi:MAG: aldo/keto reductase [Mogibacterium sp.]|nr:aldo/keto reductase [Mogibacterium sp.]
MKYRELCGEKVSLLGFGMMRLPQLEDKSINQEEVNRMADYAIEHGVNYFDTAYPYHDGYSEIALGEALDKYPRNTYYVADKFPGHQFMSEYDCERIFDEQLKRCRVDYFDFYLLHNVCENSMPTYTNEDFGIIDYFAGQKKSGRIRHLGLSTHANADNLEEILDFIESKLGEKPDFCQIQLNYIDWSLQDAKKKVEILNARDIPIIVMEPIRGGKLADTGEENNAKLKAVRPDESIASWALRWLSGVDGVKVILSGMSAYDQMTDNIKTFSEGEDLNETELSLLNEIADTLKSGVPCTACRYCCEGCPMELDIPALLAGYNDLKFQTTLTVPMMMDETPEDKWPDKCIGCGACSAVCPQQIDIPEALKAFTDLLDKAPNWRQICKEREEAAERLRQGK